MLVLWDYREAIPAARDLLDEYEALVMDTQGISCFSCQLSRYKLYPLSDDCWEELIPRARGKSTVHFGLTILCGTNTSIATFELTLTPSEEHENRRNLK